MEAWKHATPLTVHYRALPAVTGKAARNSPAGEGILCRVTHDKPKSHLDLAESVKPVDNTYPTAISRLWAFGIMTSYS